MNNSTYSFVFFLLLCISFQGFSQHLPKNLALGKPASQSSTYEGAVASKAVDGNTIGVYDDNDPDAHSVTHTGTDERGIPAWWRVDLGAEYELSAIRIYNRTDCCGIRLEDATVHIGNVDSIDPDDYTEVGVLTDGSFQLLRSENLGTGRYLMIRQDEMINEFSILSLAEVEVYGNPSNCPIEGTSCDDGDPNTMNDVEDGDCNCVGTVVLCDDLSINYEINSNGIVGISSEITVIEGDNIELSLNLEGIDFTVTDPSNNVIGPIINNITSGQFGPYLVTSTLDPVVLSVSSEELFREDGRASNVLDDDPATIWHTEWSLPGEDAPNNAVYPHEIVIDLRVTSNVSGLEYLPRQDQIEDENDELQNVLHGTITGYQIYVSNDIGNWGDVVAEGFTGGEGINAPWLYNIDLKTASFSEKSGRYVRFVATEEGLGNYWASAAKIEIIRAEVDTECVKTILVNVAPSVTYTYDDGNDWTPSDPNNGGMGLNDRIQINSGDAVISSDIACYSVIVTPGAGLTINNGSTLTASTTTLQSRSDSYSSLILEGEINGTVNYERYVNLIGTAAGGGNDLIAAPLSNQTFGSFATANVDDLAALGDVRAFAPYNTTAGAYQNYNVTTNTSTLIGPGVGYRVASNEGSNMVFTGTSVKTNVSVAVSDAAAGNAWNLIGNPYASYLDFTTFFTTNFTEFESGEAYQAIYGYNGKATSDKWVIWNLATTSPDSLIAPGQGFFVKVKSGAGDIQFTPEMRSTGTSNDFIVGRPANLARALSKLKVTRGSNDASTSIYFIEGTTKGLDPGYDAGAYSATALNFSLFTNLVEDNTGVDIAIQALPYSDFNDVVVPLGIKAKAGSELSITIDELSTLPFNINVYLEDSQNNTLTLLNDDEFTFTPTVDLNGTGRFNVHYSSRTLSIDDLDVNDNLRIYTTASPKTLFIMGQLTGATTAHLYDIQGRLVLSQKLNPSTTENTMDISTMTTGVYVVKLNNDSQIKTKKVIIK